jgi:IS5 family transposase
MMPELSTEKSRDCRKKTKEGRRFLNLKIRRTRKKKIQHFQTARFGTLSERRWQALSLSQFTPIFIKPAFNYE